MAPRGRKPKSIEQKIREGNPGNRALPEPLRMPLAEGMPQKPGNLPLEAAALWDEVVPPLYDAGVLMAIDRPALIALVLEWAAYVGYWEDLALESPYALGSMLQVTAHPAVDMAKGSVGNFLRLAEQFGLTPSARARIVALARAQPGVDLEEILGAGPSQVLGAREDDE